METIELKHILVDYKAFKNDSLTLKCFYIAMDRERDRKDMRKITAIK